MKICYIRPNKPSLYEKALIEISKVNNKMASRCLTVACAAMLCCNDVLAKGNNPVENLGYEGINTVQIVITFIAIFMAMLECARALLEGDPKRIPGIFAKYGIGVLCVYAIPWAYFKVQKAFQDWEV